MLWESCLPSLLPLSPASVHRYAARKTQSTYNVAAVALREVEMWILHTYYILVIGFVTIKMWKRLDKLSKMKSLTS